MSAPPFVHLHCHSHYSLLDGAGLLDRLIQRAQELGMNALALTDHGNLYGALEFYEKATAAGIKPIIGYEAYVAPGSRFHKDASSMKDASYHLTLLAKDLTGVKNLLRMASAAYLEGFYFRPRIDKQLLETHHEGIICLSGCVSSEFNRALLAAGEPDMNKAMEVAAWYARLFADRYYIEIQNNGLEIQRLATEAAIDVANRMGLPLVATSDVHYVNKGEAVAQDILLCINTGKFRTDAKRMRMETDEFYLRSPEEMYAAFPGQEEAVARSQQIADSVAIDFGIGARHFPVYTLPDGVMPEAFLRDLCIEGLKRKYLGTKRLVDGELIPEVIERLDRELGVIVKLGFPNYFLIVWDFVNFARSRGIEATARGSGVGSLVAFALDLSRVCPLEYDLLFERFLDINRREPPDIDIDFCQQRRAEVIQYVKEKYGHENVAQIGTFGTMAARAAIRDVGRALGLPIPRVNAVVAMVPEQLGITLKKALQTSEDLKKTYDADAEVRELIDLAMSIEGLARNVGTHAAAVVIADRPLVEYLPLQRVQGKEEVTTQWAMAQVEHAGLLKMDFLGLRNLTILTKVVDLIEQTTGQRINPYAFPLDDQETFALLCRGETKGVFQLESGGIRDLLQRMKPTHFHDIIATNALYRPGPLEGGMVDDYIEVKHGRKQPEYKHPVMKEVLEETHGVMCIHEDARISLAEGSEKPIRAVRRGDRVHAVDLATRQIEIKECHGCGPTRRGEGLKLTLANGFSVLLTPDHEVLTFDGFKEVQDLDPERDLVATGLHVRQQRPAAEPLAPWLGADEDVAYLLGQLVGDGCLTGSGISLATGRRRDHDRLLRWFRARLPELHLNPYHHERCWFLGVSSPELLNDPAYGNRKTRLHAWIEGLGLKVTSGRKRVPEAIFRASAPVRRAFLAGLIDADGCLARTTRGLAVCFLSSTSPVLLEDVRRLCQLEGIAVTLREHRVHLWNLVRLKEILDPYLVVRSFRGKLSAATSIGRVPREAVFEAIPAGQSQRAFCRETGIERRGLHHPHPFVKTSTAAKAGVQLGDVRFFPIVRIERLADQQFYGMSVADHHNLLANGIVVKNCYQEQVMRILNRLGGIELAAAYTCIKAISKKKLSLIEKNKEQFVQGAQDKGLSKQEAEELFGLIEKFAGYGFNKCVVGETELVHAKTGQRITVGELFRTKQPFVVHALGEDGKLRLRRVTDVVWNGRKRVYKLTTRQGKTLTATANHPLRTLDGWTHLGDLKPGDRIAAPREVKVQKGQRWPQHEIVALAGLLSEGNTCHPSCLYFYNNNLNLIEDFCQATSRFSDSVAAVSQRGDGRRYEVCVSTGQDARFQKGQTPWNARVGDAAMAVASPSPARSGMYRWAKRLGILNVRATRKWIPDVCFALRDADLELLIGRLWAGDGFVGSPGQMPYYATSSAQMARDLQVLLLRLGIVSGIHPKVFRCRHQGRTREYDGYTVHLVGDDSVRAFLQRIAPQALGRESEVATFRQHLDSISSERTSKDTLPAEIRDWVDEERQAAGLTWRELEARSGVSMREFAGQGSWLKRGFRRATIERLARFFGSERLSQAAQSDLFWDTVVSIEPQGIEDTYDLTVEDDHNFVANGLVVHNSHSTAYALVAYMTAYLKAHYPVEFMAALLTSDISNRNFTHKDSLVEHVEDCQRMKIEVIPPDVNRSGVEFIVTEGKIVFGLSAIKGCGGNAAEALVAARKAKGPFKSLFDFCERIDSGAVGRGSIESLIKAGAFDSLTARRSQLFAILDRALQAGAAAATDRRRGQKGLFGDDDEEQKETAKAALPDIPEWEERDKLTKEKEVLGFYLTSHPLAQHARTLATYCSHTSVEAAGLKHRTEAMLGGMLAAIKLAHTKNPQPGKPSKYAMFDLEDTEGIMRCILWPEPFTQYGELVQPDAILAVRGKIDKRPGSEEANFIVDELIPLDDLQARYTRGVVIRLIEATHGMRGLEQLYEILRGYPGSCELKLRIHLADGRRVQLDCEGLRVDLNAEMRRRIDELLGPDNFRLIAAPHAASNGGKAANSFNGRSRRSGS